MPLACNIDRRGRIIRLFVGVICLLAGTGLLAAAWFLHGIILMIFGFALLVAGGVCVWQGVVGYCIARGMGIRTPV